MQPIPLTPPTESINLRPPAWAPSALVSVLGMGLAGAFGCLLVIAIRGAAPAPLDAAFAGLLENPGARLFLGAAAGLNLVLGLLVSIGFGERSAAIAAHHIGIQPVQETESPCQLVEDARGWWELRLDWETVGQIASGRNGVMERDLPETIAFRLDEAAAGAVSRLFHPGEVLRLRWMDLPATAGGPVLLEMCAQRRTRLSRIVDSEDHRLAA